ncbi:MAG: dehydrogenase [Candidatus Cloacimonas sp. 4484_143]|nr:MAG: dehydrogenase [Candidatus Cloacimonas sp. 4484_143]RLC50129.1 MAG: NAD(P)/FAD-dependent oxidoreductase [Candidatus Cloacimonadota bacterium]RLC51290.1 MAG: NAD(P)/FAD-dependent oxidoreductase [Candidatus Cloacimonadota bacterium]
MKIAIIGFGAAAIGFIEKMKDTEHELHIFEKSKDIYSSSISGIRADGKLFVSKEMGGDIDVDVDLQNKLVQYYIDKTEDGKFEQGSSFASKEYYEDFYSKGFLPIHSEFYHIGTDQLKQVLYTIYEDFKVHNNIHFHFNAEVQDIEPIANTVIINNRDSFDRVIVAVGRSGHKLIKKTINKFPDLITDNTKVDLGVRYEVPNHIVEELNREMYEFKIKYKSKTGYMVRTFCNNPSGFVVTENYGDFVTVNGHSKLKEKSRNTNFAILTTVQLTEPFNDPIGYGSHIAQLSNLLAGENKVILQTYSNFRDSKRTKHLYRVLPTLEKEKYILGDINLAFPRRIAESIIDFIENLNHVIPGIANEDNLLYAPEIKFYSNRLDNANFFNLKFVGDCSGSTRSIIYATAHGWLMADEILTS